MPAARKTNRERVQLHPAATPPHQSYEDAVELQEDRGAETNPKKLGNGLRSL